MLCAGADGPGNRAPKLSGATRGAVFNQMGWRGEPYSGAKICFVLLQIIVNNRLGRTGHMADTFNPAGSSTELMGGTENMCHQRTIQIHSGASER